MSRPKRCLYLFSSNQSRLYAQDILNVLGAPEGHPYTFRYDAKYVEDNVRHAWGGLQDTPIMVVFSLQQKAGFQTPAFIPVRRGYVLRTYQEGESYFVEFRLKEYVGLPQDDGGTSSPKDHVTRFTASLSANTAVPYAASASLGTCFKTAELDVESDPSVLFARIGFYLSQTDTFEDARFVRVLGIRSAETVPGAVVDYLETYPAQPFYRLRARSSYDLVLFHAQPKSPTEPTYFQVFGDDSNVRVLGGGRVTVASRYDRVSVRLVTADATGLEDHEAAVVLEPSTGVQGPVVSLKVRIEADRGRAVGIATAQALALIVVALAGALSSTPIGVRIGLAVIGALAAVGLGLVGAAALRPPSLPSATPRPSQTGAH